MRNTAMRICSVIVILASLFLLYTSVVGLQDAQNLNSFESNDNSPYGLGQLDILLDGLDQLEENEQIYLDGVDTYTQGLKDYEDGVQQLAEGKAQLIDGERQVAEGQAELDANTQAYEEGKAALAKIDPLMPYLDEYIEWRDSGLASAPGFTTFQEWFVAVVRPLAAQIGLEIPSDVTDFPQWMADYVADGKAQLKMYEDGQVQLAEGKAQLAQGYADYASGQQQLADGAKQLEDGRNQLAEYEDGERQVIEGLEIMLNNEPRVLNYTGGYKNNEGKGDKWVCPSVSDLAKERLGEDFTYYKTDENGDVVVANGQAMLNIDVCRELAYTCQDYINCYQGNPNVDGATFKRIFYSIFHPNGTITMDNNGRDVTLPCKMQETCIKEVAARLIINIFGMITAVLGLITGILTFSNKEKKGRKAVRWGRAALILAVITNLFGVWTHYLGYTYPLVRYEGGEPVETYFASHLPAVGMIVFLAVMAVMFFVIKGIRGKNNTATLSE